MTPYISLLTDPTIGGVPASYAILGDVNIAEPGAHIHFAGGRVVAETTRQKGPGDQPTAEFMLRHGMVDLVVPRADLRSTLSRLLRLYLTRTCATGVPAQTGAEQTMRSVAPPKAESNGEMAHEVATAARLTKVRLGRRAARNGS